MVTIWFRHAEVAVESASSQAISWRCIMKFWPPEVARIFHFWGVIFRPSSGPVYSKRACFSDGAEIIIFPRCVIIYLLWY
jgi:hypothetical protein